MNLVCSEFGDQSDEYFSCPIDHSPPPTNTVGPTKMGINVTKPLTTQDFLNTLEKFYVDLDQTCYTRKQKRKIKSDLNHVRHMMYLLRNDCLGFSKFFEEYQTRANRLKVSIPDRNIRDQIDILCHNSRVRAWFPTLSKFHDHIKNINYLIYTVEHNQFGYRCYHDHVEKTGVYDQTLLKNVKDLSNWLFKLTPEILYKSKSVLRKILPPLASIMITCTYMCEYACREGQERPAPIRKQKQKHKPESVSALYEYEVPSYSDVVPIYEVLPSAPQVNE